MLNCLLYLFQILLYGCQGERLHKLMDENLSSVCSICLFHPSRQIVFGGNSSGRVHVFMWISCSLFMKHMARIESNTPNCFHLTMNMEFYCFTPCYFLFFGLISVPRWYLNFRAWFIKRYYLNRKWYIYDINSILWKVEWRLLHVLKIQSISLFLKYTKLTSTGGFFICSHMRMLVV